MRRCQLGHFDDWQGRILRMQGYFSCCHQPRHRIMSMRRPRQCSDGFEHRDLFLQGYLPCLDGHRQHLLLHRSERLPRSIGNMLVQRRMGNHKCWKQPLRMRRCQLGHFDDWQGRILRMQGYIPCFHQPCYWCMLMRRPRQCSDVRCWCLRVKGCHSRLDGRRQHLLLHRSECLPGSFRNLLVQR